MLLYLLCLNNFVKLSRLATLISQDYVVTCLVDLIFLIIKISRYDQLTKLLDYGMR